MVQTASDGAYKSILASNLKTYFNGGSGSSGSSGSSGGFTFPITAHYVMNGGSVSTSGTNVTSVADLSGSGFTGTPYNGGSPLLTATAINSKPALNFNQSGMAVDLGAANLIPDPGDFVIFQVLNFGTAGCSFGGGANSWGIQITESNMYAVCNGSLVQCSIPSLLSSGWNIITWGRYSGSWTATVNGTPYNGGTNITNIRGVSNGYIARDLIGAKWDGNAISYFTGYISDTAVLLSPTKAQMNTVGNYYKSYYNLNWNNIS
ncbi:MAG: hypothetical protein V7L23_33355 [Nostoc sp.]|uniref:hypothetical protein n=1 Tax=Nostoc sp. TaxID=1180 RepID=UPI002FEFCE94